MAILKLLLLSIAVCAAAKAAPSWSSFGGSGSSIFDEDWGSSFGGNSGSANQQSGRASGYTNRRSSAGKNGRNSGSFSSFDLNSFTENEGNSNSRYGSWSSGNSKGTAAGVSSKAMGHNSRVQTTSNSHIDLSNGASSSGSSSRFGEFGESSINLDLFTASGNNRRAGASGRTEKRQKPAENFGSFGEDDGFNFGSVSASGRQGGSGRSQLSGSLSSSGSSWFSSNRN